MKIVGVIQARMGSSRLPGKTLRLINGKPLLQRVIERVQLSKSIHEIIVATTDQPEDKQIVKFCNTHNIRVFAGSESDVLKRFSDTARASDADIVVRLTADDPLKDPELIDQLVNMLVADDSADYASNTLTATFPEGLDCEVIRVASLFAANKEAAKPSEREHVTSYIYNSPHLFKVLELRNGFDAAEHRWTVDYLEDLLFAEAVYKEFEPRIDFGWKEILSLVTEKPDIANLNKQKAVRNEGYLRSLQDEDSSNAKK